jgi:nitronate monooxygenase
MGPINPLAPEFPRTAEAITPLRMKAEQNGAGDFSPLWAGASASMCREIPAGTLTLQLMEEARRLAEE